MDGSRKKPGHQNKRRNDFGAALSAIHLFYFLIVTFSSSSARIHIISYHIISCHITSYNISCLSRLSGLLIAAVIAEHYVLSLVQDSHSLSIFFESIQFSVDECVSLSRVPSPLVFFLFLLFTSKYIVSANRYDSNRTASKLYERTGSFLFVSAPPTSAPSRSWWMFRDHLGMKVNPPFCLITRRTALLRQHSTIQGAIQWASHSSTTIETSTSTKYYQLAGNIMNLCSLMSISNDGKISGQNTTQNYWSVTQNNRHTIIQPRASTNIRNSHRYLLMLLILHRYNIIPPHTRTVLPDAWFSIIKRCSIAQEKKTWIGQKRPKKTRTIPQ